MQGRHRAGAEAGRACRCHPLTRRSGRGDALYAKRAELHLDPEQLQLLSRYHTEMVRDGARLSSTQQARLRLLNEQISRLRTRFKQTVLKATADSAVVVDDVAELQGLAPGQIGAAQQAAGARGLTGKWLITLQNTTNQPVLAHLSNRALRERIYKASISRGMGGAADNREDIVQLVRLRAERAALLGYPSHAAYQLGDESSGTPQAVQAMISQVAPAAMARAREEAADIQKLINAQAAAAGTAAFELQPWDWSFYAEQVRKQRYDFDQALVGPYFELDRVLKDGVFYAANQLYGLTFKERHDLPVYQPDVRVFEVFDANGAPLALFLADYFARDNKQGGRGWPPTTQSRLLGKKPVVANHLNIPATPGQPVLLSFEEVTAMFHEFGHALHGMLSDVTYPKLSGTQVPRDFVEYPPVQRDVGAWSRSWWRTTRVTTKAASRCRPRCWRRCSGRSTSTRVTPRPSISRRCSWTSRGTWPSRPRCLRPRALPPSKRPPSSAAVLITRPCRHAITPATSRTSSRATTRPPTTPTCGARCWRATPASGSTPMAA